MFVLTERIQVKRLVVYLVVVLSSLALGAQQGTRFRALVGRGDIRSCMRGCCARLSLAAVAAGLALLAADLSAAAWLAHRG